MPFQSQSQRRFMYAKHPKMAEEFEEATPEGDDLPDHVAKKKALKGMIKNHGKDHKRPTDKY